MIENVMPRADLRTLCRRKFRQTESKSVDSAAVEDLLKDGWKIVRKNKRSTTLERQKPHNRDLEDRVWSLFYRMGFTYLSGDAGGSLQIQTDKEKPLLNQIDCVAFDDEIALAAECKSSQEVGIRVTDLLFLL